jgi:hypothetical protein
VIANETTGLKERLRPHVPALERAARAGDRAARQVMAFYDIHLRRPDDVGAIALCTVVADEWLAALAPG